MTGFDVIAILVILASAAAGWVRGGTREIITLLSFVLAAFIALVALPLSPCGSRKSAPAPALYTNETPEMRALIQEYAAFHEIPEATHHPR